MITTLAPDCSNPSTHFWAPCPFGSFRTLKAIDGALHAGFQIVKVLALVDRQEGGREELQRKQYDLEAIYTTEDLLRVVRRQCD